jgi:hypothetical protein
VHTQPMADSLGDFGEWKPTAPENPNFKCRCGSNDISDMLTDCAEQAAMGEMSPQRIIREFQGVANGLGMIRVVK